MDCLELLRDLESCLCQVHGARENMDQEGLTDCLQHVSLLQKQWRPPKWFKLSVCENDTVQGRTVIPDVADLVEQCHTSSSSISQNYRVCYFLLEGSGRRVWPAQLSEMALVFLLKACEPVCTNVSVAVFFFFLFVLITAMENVCTLGQRVVHICLVKKCHRWLCSANFAWW